MENTTVLKRLYSRSLSFIIERPLPVAIISGIMAGLLLIIIHVSNIFSYLSDRPETCMNCHIMGTQYATWMHSAHREVTNCNDCHVPQDNIIKKYMFKAMDGLRHSYVFTLRAEPQAIIIKKQGEQAVSDNCKRCHESLFLSPALKNENLYNVSTSEGRFCWHCHRETPHGLLRSLSSNPYARVPTTDSMIPAWLDDVMKKEQAKILNTKIKQDK